jgi:hypothetical protein
MTNRPLWEKGTKELGSQLRLEAYHQLPFAAKHSSSCPSCASMFPFHLVNTCHLFLINMDRQDEQDGKAGPSEGGQGDV